MQDVLSPLSSKKSISIKTLVLNNVSYKILGSSYEFVPNLGTILYIEVITLQ